MLSWRKAMTEESLEQEVQFYRQAIIEGFVHADHDDLWDEVVPEKLLTRFVALSRVNLVRFRHVCARLLEDDQWEVRLGTIKLLRTLTIKDDILAMLLVTCALKQEDVREEALSSLKRVGTRIVIPQLFLVAEKGSATALDILRRTQLTAAQRERGIAIAHTYLDARDYRLREAALFFLQKYSSIEREAPGILVAVHKYLDELFIGALKDAPPELVLEPLQQLRSAFAEKYADFTRYAEYQDLSSAIEVLEQRRKDTSSTSKPYNKRERQKKDFGGEDEQTGQP
jgi:hypothetical protein